MFALCEPFALAPLVSFTVVAAAEVVVDVIVDVAPFLSTFFECSRFDRFACCSLELVPYENFRFTPDNSDDEPCEFTDFDKIEYFESIACIR